MAERIHVATDWRGADCPGAAEDIFSSLSTVPEEGKIGASFFPGDSAGLFAKIR